MTSVLQYWCDEVSAGRVELVACWQYILYDETPLKMGVPPISDCYRVNPEALTAAQSAEIAHSPFPDAMAVKKERGVAKIVAAENSVTLVLKDTRTEETTILSLPLLCPLLMVDKSTGIATHACLQEHAGLKTWSKCVQSAGWAFTCATCDKAASNKVAEDEQPNIPTTPTSNSDSSHQCIYSWW